MNTSTDTAARIRDAVDVLAHADGVLAEAIEGSVLDNRTEVAETRVGLVVVREFLAAMAASSDTELPARDLVQALGGPAGCTLPDLDGRVIGHA